MRAARTITTVLALTAALAGTAASGAFASPAAGASAVPPGYWTYCADPPGVAYGVKHHNASCRVTNRIRRKFSRDNTEPEGWRCNFFLRRGFKQFRCAKSPGVALLVIAWRTPRAS